MSKKVNGYATTKDGYVTPDASLFWNPGNPNLHWGLEGLSGINGKRYLHYPAMNFYVNEDGTVRAFGQDRIPIISKNGKNYIEIIAPSGNETSSWSTGHGIHTVQNYARIPIENTTKYIVPQLQQEVKHQNQSNSAEIPIVKPSILAKPKVNTTYIYSPDGKLYAKRVWRDGEAGIAYITSEGLDLTDYMKKYPWYSGDSTEELFSIMNSKLTGDSKSEWTTFDDYKQPGKVYTKQVTKDPILTWSSAGDGTYTQLSMLSDGTLRQQDYDVIEFPTEDNDTLYISPQAFRDTVLHLDAGHPSLRWIVSPHNMWSNPHNPKIPISHETPPNQTKKLYKPISKIGKKY